MIDTDLPGPASTITPTARDQSVLTEVENEIANRAQAAKATGFWHDPNADTEARIDALLTTRTWDAAFYAASAVLDGVDVRGDGIPSARLLILATKFHRIVNGQATDAERVSA